MRLLTTIILIINSFIYCNAQQKRVLVIENYKYSDFSIQKPVYLDSVIARLQKEQYEVTRATDLPQTDLKRKLRAQFRKGSTGTEVVIVVGAGFPLEENNFFFPADAEIWQPADLEYESINFMRFLGELSFAKPKEAVLIFDVEVMNRLTKTWIRGFEKVEIPEGMIVAYSPRTVGNCQNANETYWKALYKWILAPNVDVVEAFKHARIEVQKTESPSCLPWEMHRNKSVIILDK